MEKSGANFGARRERRRMSAAMKIAKPSKVLLSEALGRCRGVAERLGVRNLLEEAVGFAQLEIEALGAVNLRLLFQLGETRLVGAVRGEGGVRIRGLAGGGPGGFLAGGIELANVGAVGGELGVDAGGFESPVFEVLLEACDALEERGGRAVPGEAEMRDIAGDGEDQGERQKERFHTRRGGEGGCE